jgi:hypothetical protein
MEQAYEPEQDLLLEEARWISLRHARPQTYHCDQVERLAVERTVFQQKTLRSAPAETCLFV